MLVGTFHALNILLTSSLSAGYLLKVGSESQGGSPTPQTINAIAATLVRNSSSTGTRKHGHAGASTTGTVLIRGFIYGSQVRYARQSTNAMCLWTLVRAYSYLAVAR